MRAPDPTTVLPDDHPMSLRALATASGVSLTSLRNWTKRHPRPLKGTRAGSTTVYTCAQLRAFCAAHPDLPAARNYLFQAPAVGPKPPGADPDPAHVAAALRNLRAASSSTLDAALSAVRLAEAAAVSHREQIESLAATITAYDDLITQMTGPVTAPR